MLDINDYNLDSISPISAAKYSCFGMAGMFAGRKALQLTAFISFKAAGKVAATFNKAELAQKLDNNSTYYLGLTKKNLVRDLTIAGGLLAEGLYLSGYTLSPQENSAPEINDPIPEPAKNETEPVVNNNETVDPSFINETIVPNNSTLSPVSNEEPAPVVPDLPSQPELSYCSYLLHPPVCDAASPYFNSAIEGASPYINSAIEVTKFYFNYVMDANADISANLGEAIQKSSILADRVIDRSESTQFLVNIIPPTLVGLIMSKLLSSAFIDLNNRYYNMISLFSASDLI